MKKRRNFPRLLSTIALLLITLGQPIHAQTGGGYELTWMTIDGGGAMTGGAYSLVSSIGQPEPGSTQSGGAYSLNGGVIDAGDSGEPASPEQKVFAPLIQR